MQGQTSGLCCLFVTKFAHHFTPKAVTTLQAERTTDSQISMPRVAWLFPSLARGSYWHPLFSRFSQRYPETVIYTGEWPGFAAGFENDFTVEVLGETKVLKTTKAESGYSRTYIFPSWEIVPKLLAFRPDVIFTSAFSLWTAIALLFKFFFGSRVVVLFDGVSPGVDHLNSGIRVFPRRLMSQFISAFIANSKMGKQYLTEVAWAKTTNVFVKPYLVPDMSALNGCDRPLDQANLLPIPSAIKKPVFLFVGQIVPRKGLELLIHACALLKQQGCEHFTLWVVGEGADSEALASLAKEQDLEDRIQWLGGVDYHQLGAYFEQSDVFVFPTLEDIWGMVVSEAMAFGKPVLCSQWAGATEVVVDGENGYIFDPYDTEQLAALMRRFIEQPSLIETMGDRSKQLATDLTPQSAAAFFCELITQI